MKKGISAILAGSMAMSMFASLASAADTTMTTQQRYEMLEEAGIFTGFEDGTARLNERMTRAQFARVAALLLDLDLTAPPATATFRDVPKGHWAFEEVEAAVDAGIISGVGNGLFNPNANVTIQEMARVLVDALGIETDADAEVEGTVAAWAVPYVAAAVEAGLLPETTNYTAAATRAQLVDASAVAYEVLMGANVVSATATEAGTITVVLSEEVDAAAAADFTVMQSIDGAAATAVTPSAVTLGADKKTVTITVPAVAATAADQKVVLNISYRGQTAMATQEFVVAGSLKVVGVKALNAKQLQVTFNRDVTAATATVEANYSVVSSTGTNIATFTADVLDAKNVILNFNPALTNNALYSVTVRNVAQEGAPATTVPLFSTTVSVADATPAAIASISSVTNAATTSSVTVNFSEPVASAVFRINNAAVTAAVTWSNNNTTATLSAPVALDVTQTHKLDVIQLVDFAGNTTSLTQNFTITRDVVAPTATLSTMSDNVIVVTFSKAMNPATVTAANAIEVRNELLDLIPGVTVTAADATNTKFNVMIPNNYALYANGTTRTLNVVLKGTMTDVLGNALAAQTKQIALTKDVTAPTITGATVARNQAGAVTGITLTFSEGLRGGTVNPASIFVLNANGVNVSSTFLAQAAIAVNAGDTSVTIPVQGTPANGAYTLQIPAGFATENSQAGNTTPATTQVVNLTAAAAPAATTFSIVQGNVVASNTTANDITVTYPGIVKGGAVAGSATDPSNYTINGAPLPAGTTLYLNADRNTVTIDLPNNNVIAASDATAIFRVTNVQLENGATITPFTGTVAIVDNTRPVLVAARVLSSTTIELTYSENVNIAAGDVGDDIGVAVNGAALTLADNQATVNTIPGFLNRIVLTVPSANFASGTITVNTKASAAINDVVGNAQTAGTTVTATR